MVVFNLGNTIYP